MIEWLLLRRSFQTLVNVRISYDIASSDIDLSKVWMISSESYLPSLLQCTRSIHKDHQMMTAVAVVPRIYLIAWWWCVWWCSPRLLRHTSRRAEPRASAPPTTDEASEARVRGKVRIDRSTGWDLLGPVVVLVVIMLALCDCYRAPLCDVLSPAHLIIHRSSLFMCHTM